MTTRKVHMSFYFIFFTYVILNDIYGLHCISIGQYYSR